MIEGFNGVAGKPPADKPAKGMGAPKQATQEQEEMFTALLAMFKIALYKDKKFLKRATQMMAQAPHISNGIAQVGSAIVIKVYDAAVQAGHTVEPTVLIEAGRDFTAEIADYARKGGGKVSEDDEEAAFLLGADAVRDHLLSTGAITEADLEEAANMVAPEIDPAEMQKVFGKAEKAKAKMKENMMGAVK